MKTLTITFYKLRELLKSKSAWLTILVLPIAFTLIAGSIYSPKATNQTIPIALVDEDNSEFSMFLIELIKEEQLLKVTETDISRGLKLVKEHKVEGTYIIKKGFEELIKKDSNPQLEAIKSSNSYGADAISEIIASGLVRIQSNARAANIVIKEYEKQQSLSEEERNQLWIEVFDHSESYWYPEQLMKLDYQSLYFNQESSDKTSIIGFSEGPFGVILTFLALSGIFGLASFSKEHRSGTFKRLYLITDSAKSLILGNLLPLILVLSFQACILFFTLNQFFGVYNDFIGETSILYLIITLFSYILLIASGVVFISTFSVSAVDIQSKYTIFVLLSSIVGGSFWSVDLMPSALGIIALLTPQGVAMEMFKMIGLGNLKLVLHYFMGIIGVSALLLLLSKRRIQALVK